MPTNGTSAKKVEIVTGATSGMGIDIAKRLHSTGYRVAIVGRNADTGSKVESEIGDSENARFFPADVSNYDSQAEMFRSVWSAWGRIDVLCANAGIVDKGSLYIYGWRGKSVTEVPPAPDLQCTDTDLKGVIYGTQLATHFMRHNEPQAGGRIVVNSSIGAVFPHQAYPEYCAAKAGVINFVRGMAPMLKEKENILINAVMPGAVNTPIVPPEMIAAVSEECLTPIATVVKAHEYFLNDDTGISGKALEASVERLIHYEMPELGNGKATKRAVTVWEPLFRMMHGEDSNMPDAIA